MLFFVAERSRWAFIDSLIYMEKIVRELILGTAGHVDHGKTALVKALTGVDTDRLKEEKIRGITIELGFASLTIPSSLHFGIVDVPGHERFIKNMVAGAAGIDLVLFVIAADEGVMPQSREHLDICRLLGVQGGLVALTKTDLVDEETLEMAKEEIKEFSINTFLQGAPVIPVSSITGEGLKELLAALEELARKTKERPSSGIPLLPVDRVFVMKGFGTVITGTLVSGAFHTGEEIEILPTGIRAKIRGLQVHNQLVNQAQAGMRSALNFSGIEKASIKRGDVVTRPELLLPTSRLDVELHYLSACPQPLKNRASLMLHLGTAKSLARITLLDREKLEPGQTCFAAVHLDESLVALAGERFIIRGFTNIANFGQTMGGGEILDPLPMKRKRFSPRTKEAYRILRGHDREEIARLHLEEAGLEGIPFIHLLAKLSLDQDELKDFLEILFRKGNAIMAEPGGKIVDFQSFHLLKGSVVDIVGQFHSQFPLKQGFPREELRSRHFRAVDLKVFSLALEALQQEKRLDAEKEIVRLTEHQVTLGEDEKKLRENIEQLFDQSGLQPPSLREAAERLGEPEGQVKEILALLLAEGKLVKVKELCFSASVLTDLKEKLVLFLRSHGEITTQQFKQLTGVSRKYTIPLAEHFDADRITMRIGEKRTLRGET